MSILACLLPKNTTSILAFTSAPHHLDTICLEIAARSVDIPFVCAYREPILDSLLPFKTVEFTRHPTSLSGTKRIIHSTNY